MAVFPDRFIKGSRFTTHFTLDDPSDQVVPKPGTDLVPGVLALNLGNNLPADTTNATDALTAAGFNAMANQVDTTDPFCGNAIQQAVTVAVGQSIACDAAAQEAIACAIASNPEAVACLQAVLCGSTTSGKYYVVKGSTPSGNAGLTKIFKVDNGVVTDLTPSGLSGPTDQQVPLAMNTDKPVAYLGETDPLKIHQQTITDTGVTDTVFNLGTLGITTGSDFTQSAFYRNGALYIVIPDSFSVLATRSIWKLTLNSQGLITGGSQVVSNAFSVVHDIQGNFALCLDGAGNTSVRIVNITTGSSAIISGENYGGTFNTGCLSPDGARFFLFSPVGNAGVTTTIKTGLTSNAVVQTIRDELDIGKIGFVSADGTSLITIARYRQYGILFQTGVKIYDTTTLVPKQTKMHAWPSSWAQHEMWADPTHSIVPSNNALGFDQAIKEYQLFEDKNGVWTQVARIEHTGKITGIHRVQ